MGEEGGTTLPVASRASPLLQLFSRTVLIAKKRDDTPTTFYAVLIHFLLKCLSLGNNTELLAGLLVDLNVTTVLPSEWKRSKSE